MAVSMMACVRKFGPLQSSSTSTAFTMQGKRPPAPPPGRARRTLFLDAEPLVGCTLQHKDAGDSLDSHLFAVVVGDNPVGDDGPRDGLEVAVEGQQLPFFPVTEVVEVPLGLDQSAALLV